MDSKIVLCSGEEFRASLSCRLGVLSIGSGIVSCSGKVVVVVAGACIEVRWLCGGFTSMVLARAVAVCSPEPVVYGCALLFLVAALPLLNCPHFIDYELL